MTKSTDEFAPLSDMDGWNTDEKCPYPDCVKSIGELYEYIRGIGSTELFDCPHCERPIKGEAWLQYILQRPAHVVKTAVEGEQET